MTTCIWNLSSRYFRYPIFTTIFYIVAGDQDVHMMNEKNQVSLIRNIIFHPAYRTSVFCKL